MLGFSVVQFIQGPLEIVPEEDGAMGIEPLEVSINDLLNHLTIARKGHLERSVSIHGDLDLLPLDWIA